MFSDRLLPDEPSSGFLILGQIYLLLILAGALVDAFYGLPLCLRPAHWPEKTARLVARPWTWREVGRIALVLLCLQAIVFGGCRTAIFLGWLRDGLSDAQGAVIQTLSLHGVALVAVWVSLRRRGIGWEAAFGLGRAGWLMRIGQGLAGYIGVLPVLLVSSLAYQAVLYLTGHPVSMQDVLRLFLEPHSPAMLVFLMTLAFVVAPVVEETLFRGLLLPLLARHLGVAPAVLLTSALFALIHWHLPSFVPLFVLAVSFALAYIYTGSLWVPVAMHASFNGLNLSLLMSVSP